MSKLDHTPGPLSCSGCDPHICTKHDYRPMQRSAPIVATVNQELPESVANARRIVALWNWAQRHNLTTEEIEKAGNPVAMAHAIGRFLDLCGESESASDESEAVGIMQQPFRDLLKGTAEEQPVTQED